MAEQVVRKILVRSLAIELSATNPAREGRRSEARNLIKCKERENRIGDGFDIAGHDVINERAPPVGAINCLKGEVFSILKSCRLFS